MEKIERSKSPRIESQGYRETLDEGKVFPSDRDEKLGNSSHRGAAGAGVNDREEEIIPSGEETKKCKKSSHRGIAGLASNDYCKSERLELTGPVLSDL